MNASNRIAIVGAAFLLSASSTLGQSGYVTLQRKAEQSKANIARNAFGQPCLNTEAVAKAHAANPNVVDHVVSIVNDCPKVIRVKVCYFQSDQCVDADLQAYKRSDLILGTIAGVRYFRYSVEQK